MNDDNKPKTTRRGSLKYKTITHAPARGVDSMGNIPIDFMKKIFDLEQGDYFITDEARLADFTDFGSGDIKPFIRKIKRVYQVDVSDVPKGNLLEIFKRLERHRKAVSPPLGKEFDDLLEKARGQARRANVKRSDIADATKKVRARK